MKIVKKVVSNKMKALAGKPLQKLPSKAMRENRKEIFISNR